MTSVLGPRGWGRAVRSGCFGTVEGITVPCFRHGNNTQLFPNPRLCKALLDRITDRAHIIETGAESYRFRRTVGERRLLASRGSNECNRDVSTASALAISPKPANHASDGDTATTPHAPATLPSMQSTETARLIGHLTFANSAMM